ncbi:MAG: Na+/glucose cotransporter, partial [Sphingobacteriales bacterium]
YLGLEKAGGISALYQKTPKNFWNLVQPGSDPQYPWYAILLGYPVSAVAFFCTDQSMVQSVLGAKNLEQGQLGVSFIGWLKILSLPLFIVTGILCYVLYPNLGNADMAYMTMVTNLFPPGMNGLVIVVLIAVLVGTIGSCLNSLSTVFTMDVYVKKINPNATTKEIIKTGRLTVVAGCVFAILVALAIDNIQGLKLFDVFQAVLGFIAPPLSVVFLSTVFWKRTTRKAVNFTLSIGSVISLGIGVCYLWVLPSSEYTFWPHYLVLSFLIFALLMILSIIISLADRSPSVYIVNESHQANIEKPSRRVWISFGALAVVMVILYIFFNGH